MDAEQEIKIINFDVLLPSRQRSRLRWKELQILSLLVNRSPELVSRSEIIETIWKGTYCSDSTINQTIKSIRQKIGDTEHALIRTIPRLGYKVEDKTIFNFISTGESAVATEIIPGNDDAETFNRDLSEGKLNHMADEIIENATVSEGYSLMSPILSETALVDSRRNTLTPWGRILKYLAAFIALLTVSLLSYALGSRTRPAIQYEQPNSPRMVLSFSLDTSPGVNPQALNCVYLAGNEKEMRVECRTR
ncbi:winged helix-turn-helix domain-containing protein [Serratia fonticola]|uniref:Winged helix-turn-helix domain-containing protein n=2 Tax=Serratia fonticola TaxID=47917 RepID=A0AAJ1Y9L3_SERFO|nr:winged helix-turn-helix domain-containing protein [Serratia fonticola]MDQ9126501.1 winged helix-turn-helix domain-containing protein [Serratia fonticola]